MIVQLENKRLSLTATINKANPLIVASLIFIILFLLSFLTREIRPLACDMGEFVNNPLRILYGDLPYKDFWLLFSPGEVYLPALIYRIFGINTDILRISMILFSCLSVFLPFYLGRYLFKSNIHSIILSLLYFFTSVISNYEVPEYIHFYMFFIFASCIFMIRYFKEMKTRDIFLSGLLIGGAFYFRFYEAGAGLAGLCTSLLLFVIIEKISFKKSLSLFSLFVSGTLIPIIITLLFFINMLPTLFRAIVIESVSNGTSMSIPYFAQFYESFDLFLKDISLLLVHFGFGSMIELIFHFLKSLPILFFYLIPFLILPLFIIYIFTKPDKKSFLIAAVFFFWGLFSMPKGFGRPDLAHLSLPVMPFLVFLYFSVLILNYHDVSTKIKKIYIKLSIGIIAVMSIMIIMPVFKIMFLIENPIYKVHTLHGTLSYKTQKEAQEVKKVYEYIEKNTRHGDYIFVTPWDGAPFYVITYRKDPTYYDSMNDLILRPSVEKQENICADILSHKTKLIIHSIDWGYDNKPEQKFSVACAYLKNFIENKCDLVEKYDFYSIYKPRY